MDQHLRDLLASVLKTDPEASLDDEGRQAILYAMLGQHQSEQLEALWRFVGSITNEFKRSYLLHNLVAVTAKRPIEFALAERIARSIPATYWRFSALAEIANESLARGRQFATVNSRSGQEFRDRGFRLLREVEYGLSSIPEDDDDRSSLIYAAGHSLVRAGELDWAESLASTAKYCPENTEVLLSSAKQRTLRNQTPEAIQLAKTVAELAIKGPGDFTNRAFDLSAVAELVFTAGDKEEARKYLAEAARLASASQEANDIDGCKCLGEIAVAFAKQGDLEQARKTADSITQGARRDYALQQIAQLPAI